MTATKRPWIIKDIYNIFRADGRRLVCTTGGYSSNVNAEAVDDENRANAALIVRAVNRDHLFDEAVECLDSIATMLNFMANGHIKEGEEHIVMLKLVSEITILRDRIDEQNKGE